MKKIYLAAIIGLIAALIIPFVLGTIASISINSPANNFWTNDATPDFAFKAISDRDVTFPCYLYVDSILNTGPEATTNDTDKTITALALLEGAHQWYINCSDGDAVPKLSETRTINIDTSSPSVELTSPSDGYNTSSTSINFKFKATDNLDSSMSCSLYIDGSSEDTENAANDTTETISVSGLSRKSHTWYVTCTDNAGNTGTSPTRNFDIEEINYCECGDQGNYLELTIKEPDSGDDFKPGDNITVEVKVKNEYDENLDVVVEAALYNLDEDEEIEYTEEEVEIEDDKSKTVELSLEIPFDIEDNDDYAIYVKAYEDGNEEEQCKEDSVDIDIDKESHSVIIQSAFLSPTITSCGNIFYLDLEIGNAGKHDEDVKIEISSSSTDLPLSWSKTLSLDEGDEYGVRIPFSVPKNGSEKDYTINIKVFFDYKNNVYKDAETSILNLKVQGNCPPAPAPDVSFSTSQLSDDAFTGQSFTAKVSVTNTGNVKTTYTVDANSYEEWATLNKIEPSTLTLNAGKTGYAYISLTPEENVTGTNSFTVTVSFDNVAKEELFSVDVKKQTPPAPSWDRFVFGWKQNWQWFVLMTLLAVVIIILAILLGKQHTRKRHSEFRFRTIQEKLEKMKTKKKK